MDYIELEYTDLPVNFDYGPRDWETGRGTREFDDTVSYTYVVDKDSIKEVILNLIPEDEYEEIVRENSTSADSVDEVSTVYDYIEANFDELFERFEHEILEYFEQDASEEAARTIDPDDYNPFDEGLEMNKIKKSIPVCEDREFDPIADITWDADTRKKFNYLREHKSHDGSFSRDVKVWDLGLTPKQKDYFYDFLESGLLETFWDANEDLAKDIYQEGKSMGHLVLGDSYDSDEPDYYDTDKFQFTDLTECFADWVLENYGIYLDYYENEDELNEVKEEFIEWLNGAYEAVEDFDERAEKLVELFKQDLDKFIEQKEAPSDDLTETMFSEVEDIEEPKLSGSKYSEINESYFDSSVKYVVMDAGGDYLIDFEDIDDATDWAKRNFEAFEVQEVADDSAITVWRRSGFPDGADDFDECYDDASGELPELEEAVDFNPDFDDDFAGHFTSYDIYKARQDLDDEEAFEERDPDRYDDEHAKEWMNKHPYGWYNSESDYGVGDEDDFDESWNSHDEEDNEGEPFEPYYVVRGKNGEWLADFDFEDDAIEFAKQNEKATRVDTQTVFGPKIIWTRKEKVTEKLSSKAVDYSKYKLPHDVVDFIVETARKDIDERLYFNDHDWSSMDSSETSDWVMDRIEIKFPGWKWTDENMSYVEAIVDDVMEEFLIADTGEGFPEDRKLKEAAVSDLDIEIQETGYDELVDRIQRNIDDLEREERFLTRQAPREIGKGGNFDSQEEIDSALAATQRELERERAKLAIVRGQQNG